MPVQNPDEQKTALLDNQFCCQNQPLTCLLHHLCELKAVLDPGDD
jgi:hypothetical protein